MDMITKRGVWHGGKGIDAVIRSLGAEAFFYERGLTLSEYVTDDVGVISARQDVFRDMLDVPEAAEMVAAALGELGVINELSQFTHASDDNEASLYAIKEVETYVDLIDGLMRYVGAIKGRVRSAALTELCADVEAVHATEEFAALKRASRELAVSVKSVKSITLAVNLDAAMLPYEAGIVSVNTEPYRSGDLLAKFMRMDMSETEMRTVAPLDVVGRDLTASERETLRNALNRALNKIFRRGLGGWRRMTRAYFSAGTSPFSALTDELRFLKKGFELISEMRALKLPLCFPKIAPMEHKRFEVTELYDPITVGSVGVGHFVPNDLSFDENGGFYILTGANQGGKSVFVKSVGLAQVMFQLGLPVACRSAVISPVDSLLIHLPTSDGANAGKGRFAEECERMQAIAKEVTEHSLVLLDETFSGSATEEALLIAEEVLHALAIIGCRGIFATHMHRLATEVMELNADAEVVSRFDSLVMQSENGRSVYKLSRSAPQGRSHANVIAEKYGLSTEMILKIHREK